MMKIRSIHDPRSTIHAFLAFMDAVYAAFRGFQGPRGLTAAQRAFWDQSFSTIVNDPEWKEIELKHAWGSGYLDSAGTRKFLDGEYEMLQKMQAELGVIK